MVAWATAWMSLDGCLIFPWARYVRRARLSRTTVGLLSSGRVRSCLAGTCGPTIRVRLTVTAAVQASAGADAYAVADVYVTINEVPPRHGGQASWVAAYSMINVTGAIAQRRPSY
jgi:hypothetical protein